MKNESSSKPPIKEFIALVIIMAMLIVGAQVARKEKKVTSSSESTTSTASSTPSTQPTTASSTQQAKKMIAHIATTKGNITIELFAADAPKTVENFQKLADKGYYNGIIFHRVMKDFMIQTGDPTGTGAGGSSAFGGDFADEINSHKIMAGTVAMANRGPNTNGSQFFIVTEHDQPGLDGKHTVFGQVIDGMDVVHTIAAVPVSTDDPNSPKPLQDVKMTTVTVDVQK